MKDFAVQICGASGNAICMTARRLLARPEDLAQRADISEDFLGLSE
jgi:hypothetical protein